MLLQPPYDIILILCQWVDWHDIMLLSGQLLPIGALQRTREVCLFVCLTLTEEPEKEEEEGKGRAIFNTKRCKARKGERTQKPVAAANNIGQKGSKHGLDLLREGDGSGGPLGGLGFLPPGLDEGDNCLDEVEDVEDEDENVGENHKGGGHLQVNIGVDRGDGGAEALGEGDPKIGVLLTAKEEEVGHADVDHEGAVEGGGGRAEQGSKHPVNENADEEAVDQVHDGGLEGATEVHPEVVPPAEDEDDDVEDEPDAVNKVLLGGHRDDERVDKLPHDVHGEGEDGDVELEAVKRQVYDNEDVGDGPKKPRDQGQQVSGVKRRNVLHLCEFHVPVVNEAGHFLFLFLFSTKINEKKFGGEEGSEINLKIEKISKKRKKEFPW